MSHAPSHPAGTASREASPRPSPAPAVRLPRAAAVSLLSALLIAAPSAQAQAVSDSETAAEIARRSEEVLPRVVEWRRDFHRNPELSNREVRTSGIVAEHLRALGLEVRTGIAHHGVVGVLRGGRPGPVVALRADMDALPVTEEVDVPFRSTVTTEYLGQTVGVMHACGHDAHTAMLMGAAEVLVGMKERIPGTVLFIFQPAEEGAPPGEHGGAKMMLEEGAFDDPEPDAVFGLHVFPFEVGTVHYRPEGLMASSDLLDIVVRGRQTHGAMPWNGIDPIAISAQVITSLQTVVSRQLDLTRSPAIVTIGSIQGGVRRNIVPDSVIMRGTLRVFDPEMRTELHGLVRRTVERTAEAGGASASVTITEQTAVTWNDPALTERMLPTLRRAAGDDKVALGQQTTTAEDFSYFQERVPGMFVFLGVASRGADPSTVAPNHSPLFFVDEAALPVGVRILAGLAVDFLGQGTTAQ